MPNSSHPPQNPNQSMPAAANLKPPNEFHQDPEDAFRQRWSAAGPAPKPIPHGAKNDPRYPSPRRLRRALAFVVDLSLHVGAAAAVIVAGNGRVPALGVVAVLAWLTASFLNRVIIQAVVHTTVGKALFDLRAITPDEGRFPTFGRLAKNSLLNLFLVVFATLSFQGDGAWLADADNEFLRAVRRRDIERNAHRPNSATPT
ncbi:RDD family protein [Nocardia sp. NPDC051756]|uniref:RDD family protein n=1 Tax=Nocardia sp. NPDC051756 TaxID=3154751 RepID=UPI003415516C